MPTDLPTDLPSNAPNERALRRPGQLELDPTAEGLADDETAKLIAATKVVSAAVYDTRGEHLGSIGEIMIDKISGQVAYVVLSSGGFLGLGDTRHPLPWNALTYSVELGGYVVDIEPGASDPAAISETGPLAAG